MPVTPDTQVIGAGDAEILRQFNENRLQILPPEPQPFRTLIDLGLVRLNPAILDPSRRTTDHGRYALTGAGWAVVVGGVWLLLRRRPAGED